MLYFSYGSNMNQDNMDSFCKKMERPRIVLSERSPVPARLYGYRLAFNVYSPAADMGAGNIVVSADSFVEGCAFALSEEDLITIDLKEGIPNPDPSLPDRYRRIFVELVTLKGEKLMNVLTYEAQPFTCVEGFCPPKKWYRDTCIKGAEEMNLSKEWMQLLRLVPAKEEIVFNLG